MKTCLLVYLTIAVVLAPDSGDDSYLQESKKLEGTWSVTSVVRNNNELPEEKRKGLQIIFRDDTFTFELGEKILAKGKFRLTLNKTPRAIDLTSTDGDGVERTTLAIYDLSDDVLKICGASPEAERPSEFVATDGSNHTLTTFRRRASN